jgi:hypothetical protein
MNAAKVQPVLDLLVCMAETSNKCRHAFNRVDAPGGLWSQQRYRAATARLLMR